MLDADDWRRALPGLGALRYALGSVGDEAEWLSVEEASKYAGLSTNTIYRLAREGRVTALPFPVRIRRSDLDQGFELCRIQPGELGHSTGVSGPPAARRPPRPTAPPAP